MGKGISVAQEIITLPMPHPQGNYYFPSELFFTNKLAQKQIPNKTYIKLHLLDKKMHQNTNQNTTARNKQSAAAMLCMHGFNINFGMHSFLTQMFYNLICYSSA